MSSTQPPSHPLLQQIPLITVPRYQPPKPAPSLSSYPQYLSLSQVRVQTTITEQNIQAWLDECERLKKDITDFGAVEKWKYQEWCEKDGVKRLAPGLELGSEGKGILRPSVTGPKNSNERSLEGLQEGKKEGEGEGEKKQGFNEIDALFGKLDVNR